MQLAARPAFVPRVAAGAAILLGLLLSGGPALAQSNVLLAQAGSGLRADDEAAWPRWQGRLGIATPSEPQERFDRSSAPTSFSLLGDYYFLQQGAAEAGRYGGGFRATGGLLVGPRRLAWSGPADSAAALGAGFSAQRRSFSLWNNLPGDGGETSSVPYLGVGYTGLKSLKATGGGWGFSADVGVMALQPRSAVRLGPQGMSDVLKDIQLSPMLQLGVSYSF